MNVFINPAEDRLRLLWRLVSFIMLNLVIGLPIALAGEYFEADTQTTHTLRGTGIIIAIFISAIYIDKRSFKSLGIEFNPHALKEIGIGISAAALPFTGIFIISLAFGWIEVVQFGIYRSTFLWPFLLFLLQMVMIGVWEELAYRSYFILNFTEGFKSKYITWQNTLVGTIILTSALFAFAHLNNPNASWASTLNTFLAGLVLAFPFVVTGRLGLSIGAHFGWNFFQGGIFGFPVSGMAFNSTLVNIRETGPDVWTGGVYGPEGGLLGITGLILMLLLMVLYFRHQKYNMKVNVTLHEST